LVRLTKRDLEMLKMACQMELPLVADRLDMTLSAVHARFYWIRKKRKEAQKFINILNNAERMCPKLKKLLTPAELRKKNG